MAAITTSKVNPDLHGMTIWLTRPAEQAKSLTNTLEARGAKVLSLPMIEIRVITPAGQDKQRILNLDQYDLVFYISTNAAKAGLDYIANWWPQYPAHILNFAVGSTTAAVLSEAGVPVIYPPDRASSEALLALPELAAIKDKKALIIRGVGGREILAEGLQKRGATVQYAELYERSMPEYDKATLSSLLTNNRPDAVVITSAESMDNFLQQFSHCRHEINSLTVLVSSPRLAEHAADAGFAAIITMPGATDESIISSISQVTSTGT